jgi:uncharacterized lipoprotein YajG
MKKLLVVLLALGLYAGCQGPAASYVQADADCWSVFDPYIDGWVDAAPAISASVKDAMHQVNVGRRARISHALASLNPSPAPTPAAK